MNDDILVWTKAKKNQKFVSKGFQYFRDGILSSVKCLTFREKFYIIKKTDRELLAKLNEKQGTKAVHTLDYVHKFPSRKKELTGLDHIHLYWREIEIFTSLKDFHKERRRSRIRVIK